MLDLRPGAGTDVPADVDHIDFICHVDLPLVHVVQHLLGAFGPDLIVAGVPEQADADHDVPLQRQPLLRFHKRILEAGAAAEGDDFIFPNHFYRRLGSPFGITMLKKVYHTICATTTLENRFKLQYFLAHPRKL